ncbi:unnamed protein product, partial [Amoebophrya sp. A120]
VSTVSSSRQLGTDRKVQTRTTSRIALILCGSPEKRFMDLRGNRPVNFEEVWSVGGRYLRFLLPALRATNRRTGDRASLHVFLCSHPELAASDASVGLSASDEEMQYWYEHFRFDKRHNTTASADKDSEALLQELRDSVEIKALNRFRRAGPRSTEHVVDPDDHGSQELVNFDGQFEHLDRCYRAVKQFETHLVSSTRGADSTYFTHFIRARPDLVFFDDVP